MSFVLSLIRHGKTMPNEKKLYCGWADVGLSKQGIKEMKEHVKAGIYPQSELFYTSGMKRTNETLKLIYGKDCVFKEMASFKELNVGIFDLKSYEELKNHKEYIAWISDKEGSYRCPGGESRREFYLRVKRGLFELTNEIIKSKGESAVLLCHGGVIVAIMESLFLSNNNFYDWQPKYCMGYKLLYNGTEYSGYEKINIE